VNVREDAALDLRALLRQIESGVFTNAAPSTTASTSARVPLLTAAAVVVVVAAAVAGWRWFGASRPATGAPPEIQIERLTATGMLTHVALSPDGKYLVYTDNPGGRQSLWLRQVNGTNPLELIPPRVVGYWGLNFARDSSSIFYAVKGVGDPGGAVYQIPLLGGPSRKIVTDVDSAPALSPDGTQLTYLRAGYSDANSSALMIAGVDGSNPHPLAVHHAPEFFAPALFVNASWAPDGKRIVTSVRSSQTRNATLVTVGMAGDEQRIGQTFTEIASTGWLPDQSGIVFIARGGGISTGGGGQLWLQPYPSGPVRRLTNDLVDYRNANVGSDGNSIVTIGFDASPMLWAVPLDGKSEPRKLPSLRYDGVAGVTWTNDDRILFTTPIKGEQQIWMMDANGANRRPITTEGSSGWPRLSPDGTFIAFVGVRGTQRGIWRMNPDGTDQRFLAPASSANFVNITPDNNWITFSSDQGGPLSLWRVASSGGAPERLVESLDRAVVSPNGDRALGVLSRGNRYGVAVVPLGGGDPIWVPNDSSAATGLGVYQWTPDGNGVYFTTAERTNMWLFRLGAPAQTKLTSFSDAMIFTGAISRDGRQMIVSRGAQTRDAFLITKFR
jgi:Tol biopolymer transport system component